MLLPTVDIVCVYYEIYSVCFRIRVTCFPDPRELACLHERSKERFERYLELSRYCFYNKITAALHLMSAGLNLFVRTYSNLLLSIICFENFHALLCSQFVWKKFFYIG